LTQTVAIMLLDAAQAAGNGPVFNLEFPPLARCRAGEITGASAQAVINLMELVDGATWDTLCVLDISRAMSAARFCP
jgi:hypothetical protein